MMIPSGQNQNYQRIQPITPNMNDQESVQFYNMMQTLFKSEDFKKTSNDPKGRRDLIGNQIYEHIEKLIGSEEAPKITGMIIDLNDIELIPAVSTIENLSEKVRDAYNLLQQIRLPQQLSSTSSTQPAVIIKATAGTK